MKKGLSCMNFRRSENKRIREGGSRIRRVNPKIVLWLWVILKEGKVKSKEITCAPKTYLPTLTRCPPRALLFWIQNIKTEQIKKED